MSWFWISSLFFGGVLLLPLVIILAFIGASVANARWSKVANVVCLRCDQETSPTEKVCSACGAELQ